MDYMGSVLQFHGVKVNMVFKNKSYFFSFVIYYFGGFFVSFYPQIILDTEQS